MSPPDLWWRRASLDRVTDGDTYRLLLDMGMRIYTEQAIRLQGVNCPELNTSAGQEAKQFAITWFGEHNHLGVRWPYYVRTEKDRMTFNRYVGIVVCGEDHSLADDILAAEMGVEM